MMLWLLIAAMTAVALALLLLPLLRRPAKGEGRADFEMMVYRDQLAEVAREQERGSIGTDEAGDVRTEISRRLLAADRLREKEGDIGGEGAPVQPRRAGATAAILAAAVPLAAVVMYLSLGTPDLAQQAPANPNRQNVAGHPEGQPEELLRMVESLGRKLQQRPDDAGGWALYARSLASLGRLREAVAAFDRGVALDPHNAGLRSAAAEARIHAAGGTVTSAARRDLEAALAIDRRDVRARYYMGLAEGQAGRRSETLRRWLALEADSPPDAPWQAALGTGIEAVAKEMGIAPDALAAMRGRESKKPPQGGQDEMIRGMVDRLAARLEEEPDDVDGWRRLVRSYQVLGETAKARDALARLAALVPDDVAVLAAFATALAETRNPNQPLPAELTRVAGEILKRQPDHPTALWFAGISRFEAGDREGALANWRRLRALLKPGIPLYQRVVERIESLEKQKTP